MRKGKILLYVILAIGILLFREPIFGYLNALEEKISLGKFVLQLPKIKQSDLDSVVVKIEKQVQTPPPLRAKEEAPEAVLTRAGVIYWTNAQRENNGGLPPLTENAKLDAAASVKLQDMFAKQYFEHVSPSGVGPADLAERAGYQFIWEGENLALGNFQNDKVLVQAWMDSPGHRANILNSRYQEIGVAVGKGIFEGRTTWLAIQEFGLPLSVCPKPDNALKAEISNYESQANQLIQMIDAKRAEIENTYPKRGPEYNEKVDEYNALVNEYNVLVEKIKSLISQYNQEVNNFNICLQQFSG